VDLALGLVLGRLGQVVADLGVDVALGALLVGALLAALAVVLDDSLGLAGLPFCLASAPFCLALGVPLASAFCDGCLTCGTLTLAGLSGESPSTFLPSLSALALTSASWDFISRALALAASPSGGAEFC
jgi:hypothetical protein